jgi:Cu-Zn family superoxide dismutase
MAWWDRRTCRLSLEEHDMKHGAWFVVVLLGVGLSTTAQADGALHARFAIKNTNGQVVGTVVLTQHADGVLVDGTFTGLPAGTHGLHFHTVGACTPTFDAAGGHYNPTQQQHGFNNPQGVHAGDLTNLEIGANGAGTYRTVTDRITLAPGAANTVYDADGTSLMVHANADDYVTDPTGNSGGRIACGVVEAAQATRLPTTGGGTMVWPVLVGAAGALLGSGVLLRRART